MSVRHTAAWRLSLFATGVFAVGAAMVLFLGFQMLARSIQRRGDGWLEGELASLGKMAVTLPRDEFASELTAEVRELERQFAVPSDDPDDAQEASAFFALFDEAWSPIVAAAPGSSWSKIRPALDPIHFHQGGPESVPVAGWEYPLRVASRRLRDGTILVVGASSRGDNELLEETFESLAWVWCGVSLVGFAVSWLGARRVLSRVDRITELAASIQPHQLSDRLPGERSRDEIGRLVATFNVMLDRIETAVVQIRTIADSVAHDLRSPVTAVRGELELALTSPGEDEARDHLVSALESLDQLMGMVDATLDTAEAEAGALRLRRRRFDLCDLTRTMVELYAPAASEAGLALTFQAAGPIMVWADQDLLRRALTNLLNNALTHLPSGCRAMVRLEGDGCEAVLTIEDDGPGFPPEVRERAFEPFVRRAGSPGSGLGLALVRAAATVHGGSVQLGQRARGGSVVTMRIPIGTEARSATMTAP